MFDIWFIVAAVLATLYVVLGNLTYRFAYLNWKYKLNPLTRNLTEDQFRKNKTFYIWFWFPGVVFGMIIGIRNKFAQKKKVKDESTKP